MHTLDCNEDLAQKTEGFDSCTIFMGYGSVRATLLVIAGGGLKGELPVQSLPALAQDMFRILSSPDMTDRPDELKNLPVIQ